MNALQTLITSAVVLAMLSGSIWYSQRDFLPSGSVGGDTATEQAAHALITPEGLQQQINSILTSHGCTGIEIDGVVGPATRAAWSKALAIQGGDEITRNFYEKENDQ